MVAGEAALNGRLIDIGCSVSTPVMRPSLSPKSMHRKFLPGIKFSPEGKITMVEEHAYTQYVLFGTGYKGQPSKRQVFFAQKLSKLYT